MGNESCTTGNPGADEPEASLPREIRQSLLALARFLFRAGFDPATTSAWYAYFAGWIQQHETQRSAEPADPFIGAAAQLMVAHWVNSEEYLDAHAHPKALPRQGEAPSIASLVAETRPTVPEQVILEYLLAAGALRKEGADHYVLIARNFLPPTAEHHRAQLIRILNAVMANLERTSRTPESASHGFSHMIAVPGIPTRERFATVAELTQRTLAFLNQNEFGLGQKAQAAVPSDGTMDIGVVVLTCELSSVPGDPCSDP